LGHGISPKQFPPSRVVVVALVAYLSCM